MTESVPVTDTVLQILEDGKSPEIYLKILDSRVDKFEDFWDMAPCRLAKCQSW
jgi:hypothetical protein